VTGQILTIFDLDGTLYRTDSSFLPTMHRVYDEYGVPRVSDAEILGQVGETFATFLDWLAAQGFPAGTEELAERITKIELEAIAEDGELFEGVVEGLQTLRAQGALVTLCTNGDRRYAEYVLRTHGILDLFDALQTNDTSQQVKSDMVAQLLETFSPCRAVVIGDRYHDIEAGTMNGCITVGAAYGYARPGELDPATHIIESFDRLLPIVAQLTETT